MYLKLACYNIKFHETLTKYYSASQCQSLFCVIFATKPCFNG